MENLLISLSDFFLFNSSIFKEEKIHRKSKEITTSRKLNKKKNPKKID